MSFLSPQSRPNLPFLQPRAEISRLNLRLVDELQGQAGNCGFAPGRSVMHSGGPSALSWRTVTVRLILPVNPKFVHDLLLQMDPCESQQDSLSVLRDLADVTERFCTWDGTALEVCKTGEQWPLESTSVPNSK